MHYRDDLGGDDTSTRATDSNQRLAPSQRRLQRAPDFTGDRLDAFRDVLLRHGLPGALLGLTCLAYAPMRGLLADGLIRGAAQPLRYLVGALLILVALSIYASLIDRRWRAAQLGWIVYLGAVSVWEEWVFRLAIPYYVESLGGDLRLAVIGCNFAFGVAHYFTLRWKWYWCLAAFVGGMALSRQMAQHYDLLLVIGIHWIATFLNTPRLPGQPRRAASG